MRFETVDEIFSANEKIREVLLQTIADISEEEAATRLIDEKWSIADIAEHLAMVDHGIIRICKRLSSEAKQAGQMSSGTLAVSPGFWELAGSIATAKVEAPQQVQPTGKLSVTEAVQMLRDNGSALEAIKEDLKVFDLSGPKFPHPYFGDINAIEWLIIRGGHDARHTRQIERILDKIRQ